MRAALLLCLLGAPLMAQIHGGLKAGVPFTDGVKALGTLNSEFSRWTLGGSLELDLIAGLGAEVDLLYRRTGYSQADEMQPVSRDTKGNSWEFPLLLKYKTPGTVMRPYFVGGMSFRKISDIPDLWENDSKGIVLGAGLEFKALLLRISPELRYTRWNNDPFTGTSFSQGSAAGTRNQFELLVGFTF